jgi:hypothetical protein
LYKLLQFLLDQSKTQVRLLSIRFDEYPLSYRQLNQHNLVEVFCQDKKYQRKKNDQERNKLDINQRNERIFHPQELQM